MKNELVLDKSGTDCVRRYKKKKKTVFQQKLEQYKKNPINFKYGNSRGLRG